MLTGRVSAVQAKLAPTVNQTIGPFYPVERMLDQDADLTIIRGRQGRAKGQVIEVVGRVLDPSGRPLPNARLDIWQANAAGRYAHPGDDSPAPLDPNFQGSAIFCADAGGRFRFRTIKPGPYPGRVAHIHLDVTYRTQRVITQMYFPDEPGNQQDSLLSRIPAGPLRDRLIAIATTQPRGAGALIFRWDVVLEAS
jgi:protocatechuate 3,4-dioxygenase beta subunit